MGVLSPTEVPPPPLRPRASRGRWDAIVVGSGVGGSVAAALLAAAGRRVLVVEKNPTPGGILASYRRDGFKVDLGSHLVASGEAGTLGRVLRRLGLARPRFLTHPTPVRSRGLFDMAAPATRRELVPAALEAARRLGLSWAERARMARLLLAVLTLPEARLRRWDERTLDDFLLRHTRDPRLYYFFAFLASIFFVLPPWRVAAGEAIRALRRILLDYRLSYVEGGMDGVAHALLGVVVAAGGEVAVDSRVTAIARAAGGGLEVTTAGGDVYAAPAVAADLAPVDLLGLLRDVDVPAAWAARARSVVASGAAHQVKLAFDRPLLAEGCLIGGVSLAGRTLADLDLDLLRATVDDIERGVVADPLPLYGPVPTNYDPSLAPPGRQLLLVSAYGPTTPSPADPPERWRDRAMEALRRVVPGLDDHLLWVDFRPVPEIGAWMGKSANAAIANAQTPDQVGPRRLPVATPVPGLVLCGDGAGGRGVGTELAASSAIEAAAALLGGG